MHMVSWFPHWVLRTPETQEGANRTYHALIAVGLGSQEVDVFYGEAEVYLLREYITPRTRWNRRHPVDVVRLTLGGQPPLPDFAETVQAVAAAWGLPNPSEAIERAS